MQQFISTTYLKDTLNSTKKVNWSALNERLNVKLGSSKI